MRKLAPRLLPTLLIISVFSCGKKPSTARESMNRAQQYIDENKFTQAIKDFEDLIKRFPTDPLAVEAQYRLGDVYMAHEKDFDRAILEYGKVVEKYPDSDFAINAQFMLGYIHANYLKDYKSAELEYKAFLENYSDKADSGLIRSVEFELRYLGKDLNEVPQLKHISS